MPGEFSAALIRSLEADFARAGDDADALIQAARRIGPMFNGRLRAEVELRLREAGHEHRVFYEETREDPNDFPNEFPPERGDCFTKGAACRFYRIKSNAFVSQGGLSHDLYLRLEFSEILTRRLEYAINEAYLPALSGATEAEIANIEAQVDAMRDFSREIGAVASGNSTVVDATVFLLIEPGQAVREVLPALKSGGGFERFFEALSGLPSVVAGQPKPDVIKFALLGCGPKYDFFNRRVDFGYSFRVSACEGPCKSAVKGQRWSFFAPIVEEAARRVSIGSVRLERMEFWEREDGVDLTETEEACAFSVYRPED